jgi:hypothetical protein
MIPVKGWLEGTKNRKEIFLTCLHLPNANPSEFESATLFFVGSGSRIYLP